LIGGEGRRWQAGKVEGMGIKDMYTIWFVFLNEKRYCMGCMVRSIDKVKKIRWL
jgi:hypothetical protein